MNCCVVVLGMHRSGTSAVAGVLANMGVCFGPEENLIGGDSEVNARGFWEHREIVMLNEQLLVALGSSWDDFRDIDPGLFKSSEVHDIKEKIKGVLKRDFLNSVLWGLKDPRMCKLLPVWIDIFKDIHVSPRFILAYRHPEEVAGSLEKRDGISLEKAYALWLSYVLDSEFFSRGFPRTFVAYDNLLGDWRTTMEAAFGGLSLPFEKHLKNSHEIDLFLSPALRHMVSKQDALNGQKSEWVQMLYQALQYCSSATADDATIRNNIDQVRKNFRIAMSMFIPMVFSRNSVSSEIGTLRKEQSRLITDYEKCNNAYEQSKEALENTTAAYEKTKEAYEKTTAAYEKTKEAYEKTKEAYEQTKAELNLIKEKLSWKICNKLGL